MRPNPKAKREAFRALHAEGCFVLPNPWDAGSAVLLESRGFKALASTSAGMAWAMGRPDYGVARDEVLEHLSVLTHASALPVNADFENGFSDDPDGVAANVALAADTGVAGLSVEDATGDPANPLYDFDLAVARIAAARKALDGTGVVLTARSEGFIRGRPDLDETIRRLAAFAEVGADCLRPGPAGRGRDHGCRARRRAAAGQRAVARPAAGHPGGLGRAPDQRRRLAGPRGLGRLPGRRPRDG